MAASSVGRLPHPGCLDCPTLPTHPSFAPRWMPADRLHLSSHRSARSRGVRAPRPTPPAIPPPRSCGCGARFGLPAAWRARAWTSTGTHQCRCGAPLETKKRPGKANAKPSPSGDKFIRLTSPRQLPSGQLTCGIIASDTTPTRAWWPKSAKMSKIARIRKKTSGKTPGEIRVYPENSLLRGPRRVGGPGGVL